MLELLFAEFCKNLDGKLKWSETKDRVWTDTVLNIFSQMNRTESIPYIEMKEHMRIDYIWRYDPARYSVYDIELAVEHEGQERNVDTLVDQEIQHLIDIKARNKVAILYPSQGDEEDLIAKIAKKIASQSMYHQFEKYLIILGYATRKAGKPAILFRGFYFDERGNLKDRKQCTILQAK